MRSILHLLSVISFAVLVSVVLAGCGDDRGSQPMMQGEGTINPQYTQDVRMYEDALAQDPNNISILIQLGNKYYDWGLEEVQAKREMAQPVAKWQKGIEYYRRALDIDPTNSDVRTDMANLMQWIGFQDQAIDEYRKAKEANPSHPQSRINLILMLADYKQDYKGAIKEYENLLKAIPSQKDNVELKAEVDKFRELAKESSK